MRAGSMQPVTPGPPKTRTPQPNGKTFDMFETFDEDGYDDDYERTLTGSGVEEEGTVDELDLFVENNLGALEKLLKANMRLLEKDLGVKTHSIDIDIVRRFGEFAFLELIRED